MDEHEAIDQLQTFIRTLARDGVQSKKDFRTWCTQANNASWMEVLFAYEKTHPKMPSITALVSPFFHPEAPLIGLNYTPVAHNVLHGFPEGWTAPLRLCRGIIFDTDGKLVAKPFNKFFNAGEMPETATLPNEPFDATLKHDGHLGIIFKYGGRFFITTRGSFESKTSKLAAPMLEKYAAKKEWHKYFPETLTMLVEIIHPQTRVHLDYGRRRKFILIGAYHTQTLQDSDYGMLRSIGTALDIEVTERWRGESIEDLRTLMQDLAINGKEGYVVRFQNGLRVKFKFATYINRMVASKLSHKYLMQCMIKGRLERMIKNLPEEVYGEAQRMLKAIRRVQSRTFAKQTEQKKRQYLYGLVPPKESTQYYRGICREFLRHQETAKK